MHLFSLRAYGIFLWEVSFFSFFQIEFEFLVFFLVFFLVLALVFFLTLLLVFLLIRIFSNFFLGLGVLRRLFSLCRTGQPGSHPIRCERWPARHLFFFPFSLLPPFSLFSFMLDSSKEDFELDSLLISGAVANIFLLHPA